MPIGTGAHLSSYEILALIGAGGMGEVYKAHDTKLGRDVAIKVLPEAFAHDAERLARFQREAKMLAALNHPNIATIYGLEQSNGTSYLVMELVSGETLADHIKRDGAFPIEEALKIGVQIAEALEAAHEKGIIHRDLKPANVKVTPDGKVKVLDFGLAKAFAGDVADSNPSQSPTLSAVATMQGVLLGTAAYMSPEQARGKVVDKRTDIWAFGCVLYELLTGKQAFEGEDITEILATVVKTEPEWNRLPEGTPPAIRMLLRRCLRKNRHERFQDAADVRIEIEEALANPAVTRVNAIPERGWRRTLPLSTTAPIAATLLIVVGILGWTLKPAPPSPSLNPAHVQIVLPPGDRLSTVNTELALSTDGTKLAYIAIHEGVQQVYVRALDAQEAQAIPGTEGAFNPFFSPDGQWIGFFAQGKMKKVPVGGGAPLTLCDAGSTSGGASWGPDGTIVFSPSAQAGTAGLSRVPAAGGEAKVLTTPDIAKGEYSHRYPQILPDGKAVLFTALNGFGWDESRVELLRLDTGERRVLIRGGHTGRFLPTGQLIYYRSGALLAVPFDLARLEVTSNTHVTVADGVLQSGGAVGAAYAVSAASVLAYIPAVARQFEQRLVWVDRQGKIEPLAAPTRAYFQRAALSPDGQQVAVSITSGTDELWLYDLQRGSLTRLASEQASTLDPVWTPDGRRIAYRSNRTGNWNLYWRPVDGSGSEERLTTSDHNEMPFSWSPDGKVMAFTETNPTTSDIWMLPLESDRKPQPFLKTRFTNFGPHFSPDGRWLAYASDESGGTQVYVQPYPGPGRKWQISIDGGNAPEWNPKGRELFYRNGDKTMVVDVTTSPTFSAGKPRVLYDGPAGVVSPDGQRFLAVQAVEPERPPTQINIALNWFEELKRRVPTANK
jgi:serine/threonine protein kinase/Tol biopolymer transport system component